jgi:hypothetical protein
MLMPPNALTGHSRVRWVATQAVLVAVGVFCNFQVRGLTAAAPRVALGHAQDVLAFEQRLGIDLEPGLQAVVTGGCWRRASPASSATSRRSCARS